MDQRFALRRQDAFILCYKPDTLFFLCTTLFVTAGPYFSFIDHLPTYPLCHSPPSRLTIVWHMVCALICSLLEHSFVLLSRTATWSVRRSCTV